MHLYEQLGPLALSSRLKLLSETLAKDVGSIYQQLNIAFEPRWFTLFWILKQQQPLPITDLARELRQTHAAIVQLTKLLEKKGLVSSSKDKNDERRRQVSLSPKGEKLFESVEPVLAAIEQANRELLQFAAPDLLQNLLALDQALEEQPMYDRIKARLLQEEQPMSIQQYNHQYRDEFMALSVAWIEEGFGPAADYEHPFLQTPEEIMKEGGKIFLALQGTHLLGMASVQPESSGFFRLSNLAVSHQQQGKGIGKALLHKAEAYARSKGADSLVLVTSPLLVKSLNFFTRQGYIFSAAEDTAPQAAQSLKIVMVKSLLPAAHPA